MSRADTWAMVRDYGEDFVSAIWSRLRYYLPSEQKRRAEKDAEFSRWLRAQLESQVVIPQDDDDEEVVDRWMAESGFHAPASWSHGLSEKEEGEITAATDVFRQRLAEILGHDKFEFSINIGVDSEDGED